MANAFKYLIKRLTRYFATLLATLSIVFALFRIMPGDPTASLLMGRFTEEMRQEILSDFGLTRPLHEQYFVFIYRALQGDFGVSFTHQEPVMEFLLPRLLNTLVIAVPGVITVLAGAYFLGSYLGWNKDERREMLGSYLVISLRSMPHFVIGLFLLMIFSYHLGWLSTGGMQSVAAEQKPLSELLVTVGFYSFLILPYLTFSLHFLGDPLLLMRGNMIDQRQEEYVSMLRNKGLEESKIREHVSRNSLLPLVTYIPTLLGIAIGGQIVIEVVFSWPGIGRELVTAVHRRDYPVAQGAFFIIAWLVITGNLVVDLTYSYLDPRISLGGED